MGRNKGRRAKHFLDNKRRKKSSQVESGYAGLKVSYWNANGLIYVDKRESIAEYLEQHDVDIMCVAETHLRMGHHEDL